MPRQPLAPVRTEADAENDPLLPGRLLPRKPSGPKKNILPSPKRAPRMAKLTVHDTLDEELIKRQISMQKALSESKQPDENLISMTDGS